MEVEDMTAIGFLIIEAFLVATAWFVIGLGVAGWQTWMAWRYGDRDSGYSTDPYEIKVYFGVLLVVFNVVVFLSIGGT
jgi:uncharacterized membrane protein YidH (DUF202 family)